MGITDSGAVEADATLGTHFYFPVAPSCAISTLASQDRPGDRDQIARHARSLMRARFGHGQRPAEP